MLTALLTAFISSAQQNYIKTTAYCNASGTQTRTSSVYYDGLGRERLTVIDNGGGNNNPVGVRTDYDRRGNVGKKWLPVSGGAELLGNKRYTAVASAYYGESERPYIHYTYEGSGLNRLESETGPGILWKNHGKKVSHHKNDTKGERACLQFTAGGSVQSRDLIGPDEGSSGGRFSLIGVKGYYPAGSLRVECVEDEDGKKLLTFKDRLDRVILQRLISTEGTSSYADTYFVYNNVGDMIYAISPEGSSQLPISGNIPGALLSDYAQHYTYDVLHRCVSSEVPGCGATHYVYDKLNRVIFESTATQRESGQWTLTKYDSRFRPAVKGIVTLSGKTREALQAEYGDSVIVEDPDYTAPGYESQLGYPGTSGPAGFQPYIAWMYDNYDFIIEANTTEKDLFAYNNESYTQQGLCTGTLMKQSLTGEVFVKAFKYDHRGNPTRTCLWDLNHQALRLTSDMEYDFVGNLVKHTEKYEELLDGGDVTEHHTAVTQNTFDINGRLLTSTVSIDGATPIAVQNVKYDEIGRLSEDTAGAGVKYGYDIRSNVAEISTPVFSQTTLYGSTPVSDSTPSYIYANASTLTWGKSNKYTHTESYSYDGFGHFRAMSTDNDKVSETMAANRNADVVNIIRKYRGDVVQDAAIVMDGCKIGTVNVASTPILSEAVANITNGYYNLVYDADGRLIKDTTRDIASITYHPFGNLPQRIQTSDGSYTQSTYFPDGSLYSRLFSTRTIETVTKVDSKGDTTYTERVRTTNSNYRYHGNFERTPQGWLYHTATGHYDLKGKAHYWYVRDRLGSTVAVVDAAGNLRQTTGYYPSGTPYQLPIEALATEVDAATDQLHIGNRWIDHKGMALYDNIARMHDPLLARFHTVDPLYADYPGVSPWSHCAANPLNFVDPTGKWYAEVHASSDRGANPYAVLSVFSQHDELVFRTVVKVTGKHRERDIEYGDTPQGEYKISGWRPTNTPPWNYDPGSFGPNDLLALDYKGTEGAGRNGMHLHGGGKTQWPKLTSTRGCIRIMDVDIATLKEVIEGLVGYDPSEADLEYIPGEKQKTLVVTDDLLTPVTLEDRYNVTYAHYYLKELFVCGKKPEDKPF